MTVRRRIRNLMAALTLVVAAGCASAPTPTTFYLLRGEVREGTSDVDADLRVGIGRVVIAPYLLASKGIMVEISPDEIRPAAHHQWAEPVDSGLRWYLRAELGNALGHRVGGGLTDLHRWDYTVDVVVSRFHGTMNGTALLEATFIVVPKDPELPIGQKLFVKSMPLPEEGYSGVVAAERALAGELAALIAEELRGRLEP